MTKNAKPPLSEPFGPTRMASTVIRRLDIALNAWNTDNRKGALVLGDLGCGKTRIVKEWAAATLGLDEHPHSTEACLAIPHTGVLIGPRAIVPTVNRLDRFGHLHPNNRAPAEKLDGVAALSRSDLGNPARHLSDAEKETPDD